MALRISVAFTIITNFIVVSSIIEHSFLKNQLSTTNFNRALILKVNQVDKALIINSSLSIVGPIIFIVATGIGLYSIANDLPLTKLFWILLGVAFIIYGIRSK